LETVPISNGPKGASRSILHLDIRDVRHDFMEREATQKKRWRSSRRPFPRSGDLIQFVPADHSQHHIHLG